MPSSQVRLQEACASNRPPASSAACGAVADAVSSGCSSPRSPANAQQPQLTGTVTVSAAASATRRSVSAGPVRVAERVGGSATDASGVVTVNRGSSVSAVNATASTTRILAYGSVAVSSICRSPSVHDDASTTTGSSPSRVAAHSAGSTLAVISSRPRRMPLDFHGVPQHSDGSSAGQASVIDARLHSVANAAVAPPPPSAAPNIVPVQEAKNTASARSGDGPLRADPPRGSSGDHAGSTSASITLRPNAVAPATSGDGSTAATSRATDAARVAPAQCRAAAVQPAPLPAFSCRNRLTRSPVLISTGQAVWHMPSTAQVSMAA